MTEQEDEEVIFEDEDVEWETASGDADLNFVSVEETEEGTEFIGRYQGINTDFQYPNHEIDGENAPVGDDKVYLISTSTVLGDENSEDGELDKIEKGTLVKLKYLGKEESEEGNTYNNWAVYTPK